MYYTYFKRLIDILLSIFALIVLSPILLTIALLIILTERTFNIFFISIRIGQNGKAFKFYKFRTMRINCFEKEIFCKLATDDRITEIGRVLRACSLDELPQFINVLKGDMSIVGNRPLPVKEASFVYRTNNERFNAPAGITGLWQVNKSRTKNLKQRMALDVYYSKRVSFKRDVCIMLKTLIKMFKNY